MQKTLYELFEITLKSDSTFPEIFTISEDANSKPGGDHLYHISRRYGPEYVPHALEMWAEIFPSNKILELEM